MQQQPDRQVPTQQPPAQTPKPPQPDAVLLRRVVEETHAENLRIRRELAQAYAEIDRLRAGIVESRR